MALGDLEVTALLDGTLPLPLPDMYRGILPKDAAHSLIPHIVEKLTVYMSNQGYPT